MQKMDKNKDGVVTLEEFIIACQEVGERKDQKSSRSCFQASSRPVVPMLCLFLIRMKP